MERRKMEIRTAIKETHLRMFKVGDEGASLRYEIPVLHVSSCQTILGCEQRLGIPDMEMGLMRLV
jgi:hypothetical protein